MLFLDPVTLTAGGGRGLSPKKLRSTVSGSCDLQGRPNIIPRLPGFCSAPPDTIILFPEIATEAAYGSHSCGKESFAKGGKAGGGVTR